ncbi:MAG: hypothetical protein V4808_02835 [Pseudomonadota bacterium]
MTLRLCLCLAMLAACSEAPVAKPAQELRADERPKAEPRRIASGPEEPACYGNDYKSFFDEFVRSPEFRREHISPKLYTAIEDGRGKVLDGGERRKPSGYEAAFPIVMLDYYYKPQTPVQPGDEGEHLILDINQGQNEAFVVEWARVHYDGKSEGGDDLGNAFRLDGQPFDRSGMWDGSLLFEPHGGCWRLASDVRYRRN